MIIETKYSIGDTVWFAYTRTETKRMPCPDCNDTKKWRAYSPAGGNFEFACPRCSARYGPNHPLTLNYTQFVGETQCLTVGEVRATTRADEGATYMCRETGIGSGSVYSEDRLFLTKEEAQIAADLLAKQSNDGGVPWIKKQYDEVLALCDYELSEARSKKARDDLHDLEFKVSDLLSDIEFASNKEEVDKLVLAFRE